jgi:hypothetical protein
LDLFIAYLGIQSNGKELSNYDKSLFTEAVQVKHFEFDDGKKFALNSTRKSRNDHSKVIYFWYEIADRSFTNPFWSKSYIIWTALTRRSNSGGIIIINIKHNTKKNLEITADTDRLILKDFVPSLHTYFYSR